MPAVILILPMSTTEWSRIVICHVCGAVLLVTKRDLRVVEGIRFRDFGSVIVECECRTLIDIHYRIPREVRDEILFSSSTA
jgi:hypothetical protein